MASSILLISDNDEVYESFRTVTHHLDVNIVRVTEHHYGVLVARDIAPLAIFVDAKNSRSRYGWVTAELVKSDFHLHKTPLAVISNSPYASGLALRIGCDHFNSPLPIPEVRLFVKQLLKEMSLCGH
jgi:hypothetical protein